MSIEATTERPREWVDAYCELCKRHWKGDGDQQCARELRGAQAHANLTGHVISVQYGHRATAEVEIEEEAIA